MKRLLLLTSLIPLLALLYSCERYEKVPENSSFVIDADAYSAGEPEGSVKLDVFLVEGVVVGDCRISLSLVDSNSGASPEFSLCFPDGSRVMDGATWTFDGEGKSSFKIVGLPAGDYKGMVTVKRWYHSATCEFELNVR